MGSELTYRGREVLPADDAGTHSPKPEKRFLCLPRSLRYLLGEQRLLFVLVGVALASVFFVFAPPYTSPSTAGAHLAVDLARLSSMPAVHGGYLMALDRRFVGGRVPLGLKRKGLRIVVTGGAGFVGSHLVDRLIERGDSVIVVDNFFTGRKENVMHHFGNPNFELIRHDVVEPLLLEVDQIYHLACPASPNKGEEEGAKFCLLNALIHSAFVPGVHKTNVVGTLNMLGLAKRIGARFLLTSTSEVYGDPLQHPQVETYWGNVNPIGMALSINLFRDPSLVRIARIFNTYGPRMCIDDGRVVSNFVAQVEGLIKLMEGDHVGPFNLGNPGEFTMLELAKVVQDTIDPNAKIEFRPNTADDPHKRKPDITRAKELLGWEPKVSLRDGLPLMVADFRKRIFGDHSDDNPTTTADSRSI
ncbi:hypothetical protein GW17_00030840 [Ensete ventricosum]|nr:hypothetical protein GW17_00030840 [Ensete ventricosum]RZR94793.1 hypothetical protein BHM03_00023548 [Ensete ventricosum]